MTQEEIDILWQQAMRESVKDSEMFTRYHFAQLIAQAEREACAKICEEPGWNQGKMFAKDIRARGNT